jgi:hypothetical protein
MIEFLQALIKDGVKLLVTRVGISFVFASVNLGPFNHFVVISASERQCLSNPELVNQQEKQ